MSESKTGRAVEVNFDGLVGPTHNYGGLSFGNVASTNHAARVSHPREAALQGLAKMKFVRDLGVRQAVLPPHPRPDVGVLRAAGLVGSDAEILMRAHDQSPRLLTGIYSSSFMWTANAATVSASADTADGRVHFTPANLVTKFHRSIETAYTAKMLRTVFRDDRKFVHHEPLMADEVYADEGAANHFRLCEEYGGAGIEVLVYGRDGQTNSLKFPARQSRAASAAIVESHGLDLAQTVLIQQSAAAIDAGAFHNDVVVASNQNVLLLHGNAFADVSAMAEIRHKYAALCGKDLWVFIADPEELSLEDVVRTYLFNSQIVTLPDGLMTILAPLECREHAGVQKYLSRILGSGCPVRSVHYLDLRQSMNNGGGPACLRLRVVLTEEQAAVVHGGVWLTDKLHSALRGIIETRYRADLSPADLSDVEFMREALDVSQEIQRVMGL